MSERLVNIAISISHPTARHVVCSMFSAAGANAQLCDDTPAIIESPDVIHAIVLELSAVPDGTFDALAKLRSEFAATPIYVISDPEGQRHAEKALTKGATKVIAREELHDNVGELVQEAAHAGGIASWGIRKALPAARPATTQPGYEIESMALEDWLLIPGNRRLLGMAERDAGGSVSAAGDRHHNADKDAGRSGRPSPARGGPPPSPSLGTLGALAATLRSAPDSEAAEEKDGLQCLDVDCPHLTQLKEQQDAQRRHGSEQFARLEQLNHALRQEFRTHIETGQRQVINQMLARSEAKTHVSTKILVDEAVAEARRETAATIRRLHIMVSVLTLLLIGGAMGVVWRLGLL